MPQNEELIKQLKFIAVICPKVFMNTPLDLAINEIKKIISEKEHTNKVKNKLNICSICNVNPFSLNYPHEKSYICGDCYFDLLGDLVESHPVGRP